LHRSLGYVAVAAVAFGIVWSLRLARRPRADDRVFDRFEAMVVGLVLLAALAGAGVLISGGHPREDIHLLYGAIAVGVIPLARSFVGGRNRRHSAAIFLAFTVLGGVLYRLFTTG
jgi:hypothetical protein